METITGKVKHCTNVKKGCTNVLQKSDKSIKCDECKKKAALERAQKNKDKLANKIAQNTALLKQGESNCKGCGENFENFKNVKGVMSVRCKKCSQSGTGRSKMRRLKKLEDEKELKSKLKQDEQICNNTHCNEIYKKFKNQKGLYSKVCPSCYDKRIGGTTYNENSEKVCSTKACSNVVTDQKFKLCQDCRNYQNLKYQKRKNAVKQMNEQLSDNKRACSKCKSVYDMYKLNNKDSTVCKKCLEKHRDSTQRTKTKRIENRQCVVCTEKLPENYNFKYCESCRQKDREIHYQKSDKVKQMRKELLESGNTTDIVCTNAIAYLK